MKLIGAVLLALALSLGLAAPVAAGPYEDAGAAYERGDYATALLLLRPLADQGVAKAQYQLAEMYLLGEGFPPDDAQALKWYLMSAGRDFPHAQFALGFIYMNAIGVAKDYVQALKWFRLCERHVGFAYSAGKNADLITPKMTPPQITEAQKLASEWKPKIQ
jgi:hypothetical protein